MALVLVVVAVVVRQLVAMMMLQNSFIVAATAAAATTITTVDLSNTDYLRKSVPTTKLPLNSQQQRQVQQQTLNYRANYTADFQYLLHPSCTGESPVIIVTCYGGQMTILGRSDESILCSELFTPLIENGTSYQCINTCTDTSCESVYVVSNGAQSVNGVFGSVQFMCESNNIDDLAAVQLVDSIDRTGSCVADTEANSTRNLRLATMGISCPKDASSSDIREYVYDDTYFECNKFNVVSWNVAPPQWESDIYGCFSGRDCGGESCPVMFEPIQVDATLQSFANSCIEAVPGVSIDSFPIPEPEEMEMFNSVRFEASWSTWPNVEQCTTFTENPTVQISCSNGASGIRHNSSTDSSMQCTNINETEMECIGDPIEIVSNFTRVYFDCFGKSIPSAKVRFPETNAFCNGNAEEVYLGNILTLAVSCGSVFFSPDLYFECADRDNKFDILVDRGGLVGNHFSCVESATFGINATTSDTIAMRSVTVITDTAWLIAYRDDCITESLQIDTIAPSPLPTQNPVKAPITPSAVPIPVLETNAPIAVAPIAPYPTPVNVATPILTTPAPITPINVPSSVVAPISTPTGTLPLPDPASSSSTSSDDNDTVLIAAVVAGIAGGIMISLFALFVYRKGKDDALGSSNGVEVRHKPFSTIIADPSDRFTEDNTASGCTRSQLPSPSSLQQAATRLQVDPPTSDHYQVHYKDQSRSVIGGTPRVYMPVVTINSNEDKPPLHNVPFATAVPVSIISELGASNSSIRRNSQSSSHRNSNTSLKTKAVIKNNQSATNSQGNSALGASNSTLRTEEANNNMAVHPPENTFQLELEPESLHTNLPTTLPTNEVNNTQDTKPPPTSSSSTYEL